MNHERTPTQTQADALFGWRNATVVLIGHHSPDGWVLARGWRRGDRLTDVRRWRFADERGFVGQVRRLVREADGAPDVTDHAVGLARAWTEHHPQLASE